MLLIGHAVLASASFVPSLQQPLRAPQRACTARLVAAPALATTWTDLTDDAKRLTDAQIARTVAMVAGSSGFLSTPLPADLAGPVEGAMFPCHVNFVVDVDGCPLMPISSAETMSNLQQGKLGSFCARAPSGGAAAGSVITLIGDVEPVAEADVEDNELRTMSALSGQPAEQIAALPWVRLTPSRVHVYDAVRSVEAWVPPAEYSDAEPNPLAEAATSLLKNINTKHAAALKRFAGVNAGVPPGEIAAAELLAVDQMGFDMRVQLGPSAPSSVVRAGFKVAPANEEEGISVFMKLFQEAFEKDSGTWTEA